MVEELTLKNYDGEPMAIVGTSNNRKRMQTRQNQWQHLYHVAGGSGIGGLRGQAEYKEKCQAASSAWEDGDKKLSFEFLDKKQPLPNNHHNTFMDNLLNNDNKGTSSDMLCSSGGIQTMFLSKSGFSGYLKSTLRGKRLIHKCPVRRGSSTESGDQDHPKSGAASLTDSATPLGSTAQAASPHSHGFSEASTGPNSNSSGDGISLREWIETGQNKVNMVESLHIFKQVLDIVDLAHSHGAFLQNLRPSSLKLLGSYQVMYLGSSLQAGVTKNVTDQENCQSIYNQNEKRSIHPNKLPLDSHSVKKQKLVENLNFMQRWPQFPSRSGIRPASRNVAKADNAGPMDPSNNFDEEHILQTESKKKNKFFSHNVRTSSHQFQASVSCMLEEKWYTSSELFNEKGCTFASNVYSFGVLLFELHCSFDSGRSHAAAMLDLHHRILPSSFLLENPKKAGFCLWLLHPEPSSRPTTSGIQELSGDELLSSIDEEEGKSELLYFLSSLNKLKQKDASNLVEQIQLIETDIEEVEKRRPKNQQVLSSSLGESFTASGSSNVHEGNQSLDVLLKMSPICAKETRLIINIRQIESAYFSMRSNIQLLDSDVATQRDGELLKSRENWCTTGKNEDKYYTTDSLGGFFDGLCKYARYSKFKVQGILRNGEFNSSPNVICSLSFDRDEDYLAVGGVSKKIIFFGFQSLFNNSVNIHYPVVEMANKSKLSCICWNSYIGNYLASTDYDGIVKLWDATTGQGFSHFSEHSERAWSVDFSRVDPTKLASGSDDRFVKLWCINEKNSLCTIRNHANVCCVQFSADSAHLLAFSSADFKTYCYDLRNVATPWCILAGHEKAVSYTKFLDAGTLVSASSDNTLKIWDLNKRSSNFISRNACVLTLRGHTNEKVFAYYKSLPINLALLIPLLVRRLKMVMNSLFRVFAGDENQIWLLLPIHLAVSNFCKWFRN